MKTNHFICPTCGHDWYEDGAYATCDGCQTFFYVAQSRTCQPTHSQTTTITTYGTAGQLVGRMLWPSR